MIIKKITLSNFRIFDEERSFLFQPINLIVGEVGCGKSSLGRMAVTFALYGNTEVSLGDLKCKWGKGKTFVELMLEDKGELVLIKREVPAKVSIVLNGVEILPEATVPSKNEWIVKRFNDLDYFKKFRMIDTNEGINILDQGKTALRNTLVSFHEGSLNGIRKRLQEKKALYDKYNKDHAVAFKHYPSESRYKFLISKENDLNKRINELNSNLNVLRSDLQNIASQQAVCHSNIKRAKYNAEEARNKAFCPTCSQKLPVEGRKAVLTQAKEIILKAQSQLVELNSSLIGQKESVAFMERNVRKVWDMRERINYYKVRLSGRLKQKEFKYTDKDVLLVTNALKELDKFYSYYILESVKQLEPIINSIISKIGFEVSFVLSEKGDFDIVLNKNGHSYSYGSLSSGQKLMLSIAFQLSLLLDKGDTGVVLADEGFNNLDAKSMATLYEMLKELPFQIISIIHRFETDSRDINIIKLGEQDGKSE